MARKQFFIEPDNKANKGFTVAVVYFSRDIHINLFKIIKKKKIYEKIKLNIKDYWTETDY